MSTTSVRTKNAMTALQQAAAASRAEQSATGAQTDNGTNRFYTYTFSIPAPTFPAYPATWTLTPIGFTSSGDAMMGQNLTVTVTNNP